MYEKIRIAPRQMTCDACGGIILKGDTYRLIKTDYNVCFYQEHIVCPGTTWVSKILSPKPIEPKIKLNHALVLA